MMAIKEILAKLFCNYGVYTAGATSFHGTYEAKVPNVLKK